MAEPDSVAVWFVDDRGRTDYDLHDDETTAALSAAGYEASNGPGTVLGVQFADGRTVPAARWEALDEGRRRHREFEAFHNTPRPPEPLHTIRDPFTLADVEVACGDPAWLGLHDAT